jgi:hypothetical protein
VGGFSTDKGVVLPFNIISIDEVTAEPVICWLTVQDHSRTYCRRLMDGFNFTVASSVRREQEINNTLAVTMAAWFLNLIVI